jgi:hypothetical protein
MLKIKENVHYKRGYTHAHCSHCNHYVADFELVGIGGVDLGTEARCHIIGLKPGRMYRIAPANICDRFDDSEYMAGIKGCMEQL